MGSDPLIVLGRSADGRSTHTHSPVLDLWKDRRGVVEGSKDPPGHVRSALYVDTPGTREKSVSRWAVGRLTNPLPQGDRAG